MGSLTIDIFDSNLNYLGVIDNPKDLTFGRLSFEVGSGTLSFNINSNSQYASLVAKNNIFMINKDPYRSGVITHISDTINQDGKGSQIRTATLAELKQIFTWRLVMQLNTDTPDWSMGSSTSQVDAETIVKSLISDQCGPTATVEEGYTGDSSSSLSTARQIPNLTIATNQHRGAASYCVGQKYNSMYNIIKAICTQAQMGWYCYLDLVNMKIVMDVTMGLDRTGSQSVNPWAIFSSDRGTLKEATIDNDDSQFHNLIYVGGSGSGASRLIQPCYASGSSEPSGFSRREYFDDQSSLTTVADCEAQGTNDLNQYLQTLSLSGSALPVSPLVYRTDYNVSDKVDINDGISTYSVQMIGVSEEWQNASYKLTYTWGTPTPTLTRQVFENTNAAKLASNISETGKNINASTATIVEYDFGTGITAISQGLSDVIDPIINIKGTLVGNSTLTLYFNPTSLVGSKSYQVNIFSTPATGAGPFTLTITTGVSGKTNDVIIQTVGDSTKSITINVDKTGNVSETLTSATLIAGAAGGITIGKDKLYVGAGAYDDPLTGFYADSNGNFSLGNQLTFNASTKILAVSGTIYANAGYIGCLSIATNDVYICTGGTPSFASGNTPFWVDNAGKFSLGANLTWTPSTSTLYVNGSGIFTGTVTAQQGSTLGCLTVNTSSVAICTSGTATFNSTNTPFYVDTSSRFSLGQYLTWTPSTSTLYINGSGIFSGALTSATLGSGSGFFNVASTKMYSGAGNYIDSSTPFFFGTSGGVAGRFSLGSQLYFDPSGDGGLGTLTLAGNIIIQGSSSTIGGWLIGSTILKSKASGAYVGLDSDNMRVAVVDSAGNSRVVVGYLGGLAKNSGSGTWTVNDYGFWAMAGDTVKCDGPMNLLNGSMIVSNGTFQVLNSGNIYLEMGSPNGNYGLSYLGGGGSILGSINFDASGNAVVSNNLGIGRAAVSGRSLAVGGSVAIGEWTNGTAIIDAYSGYAFFGCNSAANGLSIDPSGSLIVSGTGSHQIGGAGAIVGIGEAAVSGYSLSVAGAVGIGGSLTVSGTVIVNTALGVGATPITAAHVYGTLTVDAAGQSYNYCSEGIRLGRASNGFSVIAYGANTAASHDTNTGLWWAGRDGGDGGFTIYSNDYGANVFHITTAGAVSLPGVIKASTGWGTTGSAITEGFTTSYLANGYAPMLNLSVGYYGIGYLQNTAGYGGVDTIAVAFNGATVPTNSNSAFMINSTGSLYAAGNLAVYGTGSHQIGGTGAYVGIGQAGVNGYSLSVSGSVTVGAGLTVNGGISSGSQIVAPIFVGLKRAQANISWTTSTTQASLFNSISTAVNAVSNNYAVVGSYGSYITLYLSFSASDQVLLYYWNGSGAVSTTISQGSSSLMGASGTLLF